MQNLALVPPEETAGVVATDDAGKLQKVYAYVFDTKVAQGEYSATNFQPKPPLSWFADSKTQIFFSDSQGASITDKAGGIIMKPTSWSDPVPFNTTCDGEPPPTPSIAAVPALVGWPLWALGALSAGLGMRRLRRKG